MLVQPLKLMKHVSKKLIPIGRKAFLSSSPIAAKSEYLGDNINKLNDEEDEDDLSDFMFDYNGFSKDSINILNDYLKNNMFIYSDIDAVNMNKMNKFKEIKKCKNFKIINGKHHEIPIIICAILDPHIMQIMIEVNIGKYGKIQNIPNKLDRRMHKKMMKMSMTQKTIYVD